MASFYPAVKNHASGYTFYVSLVSQSNTKIFQASPTLAAGDVKIAVDDAAPANLGTLPVVDADFTKRVKVVLSQSETNGDNLTIIFSDAAGAEWCDLTVNIQTVPRRFDDLAFPLTTGRGLLVDANGFVTEASVDGIQKNTALNNFEFPMFDSADHVTLKSGLTITAQRSIDGAAFAACANSASEVGTTGVYKINLANTDLNGDVITFLFTGGTGADARLITIKTNS
jgi:hypothetical protein